MFQGKARCQVARRAQAGDADFLPLEIGPFGDRRLRKERKDHAMDGCAEPNNVRPLDPGCHHGGGREMAELDLSRKQGLGCGGAAADINQA